MQVICDNDKCITVINIGYPGSCTDSTVFKAMSIHQSPGEYFAPGEYLLADSAYQLSHFCIPAYKAPAADLPENTDFNYCLAKSRVRNEHCIGILKGRFASLQQMQQQIRSKKDMQLLIDWTVACCILHNMLACLGDQWADYDLEKCNDDIQEIDHAGNMSAENFREALKRKTLEINHARGVLPMNQ